jgi:hypothetical protein
MTMRRSARTLVALAAAYAVALQALLLAVGVPAAGASEFAAVPVCSSFGAGHSAPAGHAQDCLGACLTGCCCGAAVFPAPGPAMAYAPVALLRIAAAPATAPPLRRSVTRANRSRAPPLA